MAIKIGDKRWYVYGYETPLTIRVTIIEIDELGDIWIDELGDIWIDEPLGHEVYEDELYDNLDDAMAEMETRRDRFTLEEFRLNSAEFILSTRKDDNRIAEEFLKDYHKKEKCVDWFN